MSRFKYISIVVLGIAFLLFSEDAFAQKYYNQSYKPSLHKMKNNSFNAKGLSFGVGALYNFNDTDRDSAIIGVLTGITPHNLSATAFVSYNWPLTDHFGIQAGADVGLLQGDNRQDANKNKSFMSVFVQPNVGINIFPIDELGLVIHLGIAVTASYRIKSKHTTYKSNTGFGILPMGQASIGYNWNLTNKWRMGVFGAFKMGFMDMAMFNLDGWPVIPPPETKKWQEWPDGYFEIGVTINYYEPKGLPFFR